MRKSLSVALIIVLALSVAGACAAEIEGKIQSLDTSDRTIVLDNGTTLSVAEEISLEGLQAGTDVKVFYEERDGKNVATQLEWK